MSIWRRTFYQQIVVGKLDFHIGMYETRLLSYTFLKANVHWIKDLNLQTDIKLLKKNIGGILQDIGKGKDFWGKAPKV